MKIAHLILEGPMQSYGYHSRFTKTRDSGMGAPTLSAVVGMVASVCDIRRDQPELLNALGFTDLDIIVRVDQSGRKEKDFQTVKYSKSENKIAVKEYLTDAKFTVGLYAKNSKGEQALELYSKLATNPKNAPYLGRKSYAPQSLILVGYDEYASADDFLHRAKLLTETKKDEEYIVCTVVSTSQNNSTPTMIVDDRPVSFESGARKYLPRPVTITKIKILNPAYNPSTESPQESYDFNPMQIAESKGE